MGDRKPKLPTVKTRDIRKGGIPWECQGMKIIKGSVGEMMLIVWTCPRGVGHVLVA